MEISIEVIHIHKRHEGEIQPAERFIHIPATVNHVLNKPPSFNSILLYSTFPHGYDLLFVLGKLILTSCLLHFSFLINPRHTF